MRKEQIMNKEAAGKKRQEERNPVARKRDGLKSARDTAAVQVRRTGKAVARTAKRVSSATNHRRNT